MIRPSDAGAPHEPHGKGCAGIGVSVRCRCLGLQDLRRRDVGLVGYRLVRGVHGGFHGGTVFAERVGPFHSSGSFRSSGISSYPSGSPVVRSPPPVVSGSGPDAGLRSSAAGFVCSARVWGFRRLARRQRSRCVRPRLWCWARLLWPCCPRARIPAGLVLEEADSGGGVVHAVDRRAHHGVNDPVVVVARPLAGEPRVHEERGVVAVRGLERCASSTRCRSTGTPAVLKAFRVACNAGDWSV